MPRAAARIRLADRAHKEGQVVSAATVLRRLWCWLRHGGHRYTFAGWGRWRTLDGRIPRRAERAVFVQTFSCRCGKSRCAVSDAAKPYVCGFPDPFSFRWLARWTCPVCGSTYVRRRQRKERWWRNWWAEHGDWCLPWIPFAWLPQRWSRQNRSRYPW
jgi:hypothetical protein